MTVLRLERIAAGSVDDAIASLGAVTLARSPDGAFAEVDDARVDRCTRALAFAGVRATATTVELAPPAGTRVAIGRDLGPLAPRVLALDLVHVRALPLGPETRRLLRTWPWRRLDPGRRARCRDLTGLVSAAAGVGVRRAVRRRLRGFPALGHRNFRTMSR